MQLLCADNHAPIFSRALRAKTMTEETAPPRRSHSELDVAKHLRLELEKHISSFARRRKKNRKTAFNLKMAATIFSVITTILVGLHGNALITTNLGNWLSALAIVTSASIAIFTTWETFFDHRWLWITYTITLNSLTEILSELEYCQFRDGALSVEDADRLYHKMSDALEHGNIEWFHRRKTETIVDDSLDHLTTQRKVG